MPASAFGAFVYRPFPPARSSGWKNARATQELKCSRTPISPPCHESSRPLLEREEASRGARRKSNKRNWRNRKQAGSKAGGGRESTLLLWRRREPNFTTAGNPFASSPSFLHARINRMRARRRRSALQCSAPVCLSCGRTGAEYMFSDDHAMRRLTSSATEAMKNKTKQKNTHAETERKRGVGAAGYSRVEARRKWISRSIKPSDV